MKYFKALTPLLQGFHAIFPAFNRLFERRDRFFVNNSSLRWGFVRSHDLNVRLDIMPGHNEACAFRRAHGKLRSTRSAGGYFLCVKESNQRSTRKGVALSTPAQKYEGEIFALGTSESDRSQVVCADFVLRAEYVLAGFPQ